MSIFSTFWQSVKDLFDELFSLMVVNLIWLLISAPLMVIAGLLISVGLLGPGLAVALLGVLPMAPATAGLYKVVQRVAEGRVISWRVFFEGFREYTMLSWRVYGLWALGLLIILFNLRFYNQMGSSLASFLSVLFVYFLLIWFALLIYIGPLMLLQTDKRIRVIARNAFLMALGRPIFTLVTLILMVVIVAISASLFVPLLLVFSFLALWGFRATTRLIADAEARRIARSEQAAASSPAPEKGRGGQVRPRE